MAQEKLFNVSVSTMPASAADFAGKENGTLTVHMTVNETAFGDSRSFAEFKATYHRVKPDAAKPLYDAISPLVGVKHDLKESQVSELKTKVLTALAELSHAQAV